MDFSYIESVQDHFECYKLLFFALHGQIIDAIAYEDWTRLKKKNK